MKLWLVAALVVAACGGADEPGALQLCALCTSDSDCESGVCKMYGDGYRKCSHTCNAGDVAIECTSPAQGFCNNMGFCGCPPYQPPVDASLDDSYRDAPMVPTD